MRLGEGGGTGARQTAEDGAFHEAGAAGIIVEERTAGDFPGREQSADHVTAGVLDLGLFGDADAEARWKYTRGISPAKSNWAQRLDTPPYYAPFR